MNLCKLKEIIQKNYIYYLTGILIVLFLKLFCRQADSGSLRWLLAPTAWWVKILTGIPFTYEPGMGYANHSLKYVIAPSCSGMQFMTILIAMLIFSFVHRQKNGLSWTLLSIPVSCLLTVFVNVLRIILSIYIPLFLTQTGFYSTWLSQDRLHTIIGTAVYFTSLLVIYRLTDIMTLKAFRKQKENRNGHYFIPAFWYFLIVLGIPFLNKAYVNGGGKFTGYAVLIFSVCFIILLVPVITAAVTKLFHILQNSL
ncbi:MAG: exosortase K [Suilimivivens sp.]